MHSSEKKMHLILHNITRALIAVSVSSAPNWRLHRKSMHAKDTCLHSSLHATGGQGTDSEVASGGHPHSEFVNQLKDLGGERQTKNGKRFVVTFPKVYTSNVPLHFPHPKRQVSCEIW